MNLTPPRADAADPLPTALYKVSAEDFVVDEQLGFDPTGQGEHIWIQVRKTGYNTRDLIDKFAAILGVESRDIGYSGLKDKNAVTTQWFSIRQRLQATLPAEISTIDGVELLRTERSDRKLRIGSHRSNRFMIVLRELCGDAQWVEERLKNVIERGFPNYFGVQRLGHDGRNIISAKSLFQSSRRKKVSRFKRGIYLSAARAWIFNRVLAQRIEDDNWLTVQAGDVCMLNGTRSIFKASDTEASLQTRHDLHDIHLTGPLAGAGDSQAGGRILELEQQCFEEESVLFNGLVNAGLKQERRALRAIANQLVFEWIDEKTLRMEFDLARGVYATSLLQELVDVNVS